MSTTDKPNYARGKVSSSNLAVALAYVAKHPGRKLFPTIEDKGKPAFKNNLNLASNEPEQLKAWQKEHERRGRLMWACSPRVCEPPIFCLDADMGPGKVGNASLERLFKEIGSDGLGSTILDTETNSTPGGGLHLIFAGEHKFSASRIGKDLDVPNYFMIPGQARSDGKRYSVVKDIAPMPAPAELQRRVKPAQPERTRTYTGDAVPLELFAKMLKATPYKGGPDGLADRHSYSGCLNFLMAAHEAAGGDESDYLELVIDWCLDDPNPDWKEPPSREWVERRWSSLNNSDAANAVTRASWFKVLDSLGRGELVGEAGTAEDLESFRADPANDNIPGADDGVMGQEVQPREYPNGYDGDGLEDTEFPPQEEVIEGLLLEGTSQTIDGDGGVGKSLIGAQMAVHRVSGMPFLGRKVKQGPCIFITHEDDYGEVKKRMKATAKNSRPKRFARTPAVCAVHPR